MMRRLVRCVACLVLVAASRLAGQQDVCLPASNSHEARTFAILSVPIAFTGSRAPTAARGISFGIEAATLPMVDSITALPTTCRPDKKSEQLLDARRLIYTRTAMRICRARPFTRKNSKN